jgi:outer membrane protein assembly factor BamB
MNWNKISVVAFMAVVVVFGLISCQDAPPAKPGAPLGPDSTWTGVNAAFRVASTAKKNIRYIMDWSDAIDTGDVSYASGETASVAHQWETPGTYSIKVQAILDAKPDKASEWSDAKSVKVILNQKPLVDTVLAPPVAVKNIEAFFTIKGHDDDGDSLRVIVDWGSKDTSTELFPTPCSVEVSHVFNSIETAMVVVWTQDWKGTKSLPETVYVPVGTSGGVKWYWWDNDEDQGALTTSLICVVDPDGDEVVMGGCEDDYKFYSVRTGNGRDKKNAQTKWPEWVFTGHPGLANGHIIVGSDEGELYALELDGLSRAWMYPGKPAEESLTYIEWGAPAFNGANIYISHDDDSIFLFQDAGSQANRLAAYSCNSAVIDAPAIDAAGNVYFGTDSGYLVKIDGGLNSPIWRSPLIPNGEVHGPIIGGDGTVYCTSDSFHVYAIDPATGTPRWTTVVDGEAFRPVLGQSALFLASSFGKAYSINPATGAINWEKTLSASDAFSTAPVVAANGYVYIQSDADVLYCLNQADGTVIWSCNCPRYLPRSGGSSHKPRKAGPADYAGNPTIAANGDIIVVGSDALYCVAGYPEGPLDGAAAWPKWQKNLYNAGK